MIRKIGALGISLLCLGAIISCEKDFNDLGTSVVNNTKFETGEILLDVEVTPVDIESVRADNIGIGSLGEYWLGVYKSDKYKKIEASFVSQLGFLVNPKTKDVKPATKNKDLDSLYVLDKVILKLPYTATSIRKAGDSKPKFRFDSLLGNPNLATSLKVFRNNTFLNNLDPTNPAVSNSFQSNAIYEISDPVVDMLNEDENFKFQPAQKDTMFVFKRHYSNGNEFNDTIKLNNKVPFIAVPLDITKMKSIFWDNFKNNEFKTAEAFNNYFRGLVVKSEGADGLMVPLSITGASSSASLEFYYTISRYEKQDGVANLVYKDTVPSSYSFPLSGVRNSIYNMSARTVAPPANNFIIQGTAGSMAKIKILDNSKLQELKTKNWLVNDASLSFYVNQNVNTDKNKIPQRLFLYQDKDNGSGGASPTQLTDAYKEAGTFGGNLELKDDNPEKYTFRITDYISDLLQGKNEATIDPLILKVYNNPTDNAITDRVLNTNVKTYNWNPRGVTLLDGNETANGAKRAVLKISYSKEK